MWEAPNVFTGRQCCSAALTEALQMDEGERVTRRLEGDQGFPITLSEDSHILTNPRHCQNIEWVGQTFET